jgi:hypothetical protein
MSDDDVRPPSDEFLGKGFEPLDASGSPAVLDANVATVDPSGLLEGTVEGRGHRARFRIALAEAGQHTDPPRFASVLRARRRSPKNRRYRRAAEDRHEVAPSHSTASSARVGRLSVTRTPISPSCRAWRVGRRT